MRITDGDTEFKSQLSNLPLVKCVFGGDPEFFVADPKGDILNSDRFFPGKEAPIVIPDKGKVYYDGIQAELGFMPSPRRDLSIFNIASILHTAQSMIGKNSIVLTPATTVKKSIIDGASPQARIFGCAPDYNAYTRSVNTLPMDATRHKYRYAGGHIHIGISGLNLDETVVTDPENHISFIKALDLLVSLPLVAFDNAPGSSLRRLKYGKAGCFRPTPYGLEYRTPSCWWLKSPITFSLIYGLVRLSWTLSCNKLVNRLIHLAETDENDVRGIVDEGDVKKSAEVWDRIRPYIAYMGNSLSNPVHYRSLDSVACSIEQKAPSTKKDKLTTSNVIPLALYQYMLNGVEGIIQDNVIKEWALPSSNFTSKINTGIFEMPQSSVPPKIQRDFFKFQKSLIKNLY